MIKDLKDLKIDLSFSQIASLNKSNFKRLVKNAIKRECFRTLMKEKESLRKGQDLQYDSLEMQPYLLSNNGLSVKNMRKIYHMRSREIQLKCSYPSAFKDTSCPYQGCESQDTQKHLFASLCFFE